MTLSHNGWEIKKRIGWKKERNDKRGSFYVAAMNGLLSDCERLWQEGADINVISRNQNKTTLHAFTKLSSFWLTKVLRKGFIKKKLFC